ncbi:hypothetical protein [Paludibacter sp. 221]|uniref:hypothetical protein n=1 Tax=Paludibacter sp. 221 TaxID=2302939 RepID=UPI0013D19E8D|nr:hypothetical protein [Paludibacter sp. 221]
MKRIKVYHTKRESPWVALCGLTGECLLNSAGCLLLVFYYSNGLRHKCLLFLPAAGSRNHGNGELYNVGSGGRYWSGSISSVYSFNLNFNGSNVYPANVELRSYGFSVRCISALNGKPVCLFLCFASIGRYGNKFICLYTEVSNACAKQLVSQHRRRIGSVNVTTNINHKVYHTKRESLWVVSNDLMGESLLNSASCLLPAFGHWQRVTT